MATCRWPSPKRCEVAAYAPWYSLGETELTGTVSWNLKTKENLDIAFGIYFYVIESPIGTKTGKIAIIK